jgi:hypothetical protein
MPLPEEKAGAEWEEIRSLRLCQDERLGFFPCEPLGVFTFLAM